MFQPSSIHLPSLKMLKLGAGVVEFDIGNTGIRRHRHCGFITCLSLWLPRTRNSRLCLLSLILDQSSRITFLQEVEINRHTCIQIDSDWLSVDDSRSTGRTTLGIIGNLQSVEEAYFDVFSLRESEFVDPVLSHLRDYGDLHLLMHHFTSKVKFYYYGLYVFIFICVLLY